MTANLREPCHFSKRYKGLYVKKLLLMKAEGVKDYLHISQSSIHLTIISILLSNTFLTWRVIRNFF